jgi:soluble lytic murein transglycosylase
MMQWRVSKSVFYYVAFTIIFLAFAVSSANADIYMYIDREGVMHFTNAPTESDRDYKVYVRERSSNYSVPTASFFSTDKYDDLISDASEQYGIDSQLVKAIIKAESDFNPRAVSKKGAMGLMQIMPQNFEDLHIRNPFDPRQNIMGGTRYFKYLYDRFDGKLALSLAAYNAGPTAVDQYNQSIPPYKETEQYVERVLRYYRNYRNL